MNRLNCIRTLTLTSIGLVAGCGSNSSMPSTSNQGIVRQAMAATTQITPKPLADLAANHEQAIKMATVSTINDIYSYGASSFPKSTYQQTNYWVDVLFTPSGGTTSNIFGSSVPSNITENDNQAVELGMQFQSSVAGKVSGIRFYKGPQNTGTHTGHLWSSTGIKLASATFTGETSTGWQQVNFSSPVSIAANTTYVASYHTNVGYYSADQPYFTACRTNGVLTALGPSPCIALGPTPTPTPTPTNGGDLASTMCVGGSKYTLDDHDWFDKDTSLSVSDNWPEPVDKEWSNQFSFGRSNNVGTDLSWYDSQADITANGLPPLATIIPGVGVALKSYEQPPAIRNQPGNQDQYFSGLLSNSKAYPTGYFVFSGQLPGGNGWWPAMWLLNETGSGNYFELDNEEQWGPGVIGANVVAQTEQGSPAISQRTTVPTGDTAQHTYGALVASNYVGFYIDGTATTNQYKRYETSSLNPIINMQVCSNNSYCAPAPAPGATAQMVVKYYAHFSPPVTPTSCSPNDIETPKP